MRLAKCLVLTLFVATLFVDSACAGYSDPTQFWGRFRQAVIDNDINTIVTLTHFPFKTRGTLDSNPIVQYNKKKFPVVYKKLVNQEEESVSPEGKFVSTTMLELIKQKKSITSKDFNTRDCLWIYDFIFEKINGCWYFTFGYLDD